MTDKAAGGGAKRVLLLGFLALAAIGFAALGHWQIERRTWKLALIAAVDARVHAAPVAAPPPGRWAASSPADEQYRHVFVTGRFLNDRETLVKALTELGAGFWVMTPLQTPGGDIVLVNRGYVTPERADPHSRVAPNGTVRVTGLLRLSEPKGSLLQSNRPAEGRWYSRDVAAIAASRGLHPAAPYFIDADATPNPGGWPVGGLTVVTFPNNHLQYAVTWFVLALMAIGGAVIVWRHKT